MHNHEWPLPVRLETKYVGLGHSNRENTINSDDAHSNTKNDAHNLHTGTPEFPTHDEGPGSSQTLLDESVAPWWKGAEVDWTSVASTFSKENGLFL